jgi:hypothetical protein
MKKVNKLGPKEQEVFEKLWEITAKETEEDALESIGLDPNNADDSKIIKLIAGANILGGYIGSASGNSMAGNFTVAFVITLLELTFDKKIGLDPSEDSKCSCPGCSAARTEDAPELKVVTIPKNNTTH